MSDTGAQAAQAAMFGMGTSMAEEPGLEQVLRDLANGAKPPERETEPADEDGAEGGDRRASDFSLSDSGDPDEAREAAEVDPNATDEAPPDADSGDQAPAGGAPAAGSDSDAADTPTARREARRAARTEFAARLAADKAERERRREELREIAEAVRGPAAPAGEDAVLLARTNPAAFVQKYGIDPDKFIMDYVRGGPDPVEETRGQVAELKRELEELKRERQQASLAQQRQEEVAAVAEFLDTGSDWPLARAIGERGARLVLQVMHDHYRETGELLSDEDAADQVEEYLSDLSAAMSTASGSRREERRTPQATSKVPQATITGRTAGDATRQSVDDLDPETAMMVAAKRLRWKR